MLSGFDQQAHGCEPPGSRQGSGSTSSLRERGSGPGYRGHEPREQSSGCVSSRERASSKGFLGNHRAQRLTAWALSLTSGMALGEMPSLSVPQFSCL